MDRLTVARRLSVLHFPILLKHTWRRSKGRSAHSALRRPRSCRATTCIQRRRFASVRLDVLLADLIAGHWGLPCEVPAPAPAAAASARSSPLALLSRSPLGANPVCAVPAG